MRVTEPYTIFPRKLASGKTVYYYQYRDQYGRRSTAKSTGCTSLPQAKRYCQKLFNSGGFSDTSNVSFETFTKNFFDEESDFCKWRNALKGENIKPTTLKRYKTSLNYQLLPFFSAMKLTAITTATVKDWVVWATNLWTAKTVNNAQGTLNLIFIQAIEKGIINTNPLDRITYRKIDKKKRELLTVEELNQLYHCKWHSETQRKMFLLCCVTGMRVGEVCALQKNDIQEGYIFVTKTLTENFGLGSTKTGLNRIVPIPFELLEEIKTTNTWVFSKNSEPIKPHCIYNSFVRRCEKLNIDIKSRNVTLHTLRNFFISYCTSENVPQLKIKAVVGHADENITEHYTYYNKDMLKEVIEVQQKLYNRIVGVEKWQVVNLEKMS